MFVSATSHNRCWARVSRLRRGGAVTVWVLVSLLLILGILAIGLDGGRMLQKRRHAQVAADAAALAATASVFQIDLTQNGNATGKKANAAQSAALAAAAANGFNNDGVTSTVTVNMPPTSGAFSGNTDCVEVIVQGNVSKSFGAIFTKNNLPVTARAVGIGRPLHLGVLTLAQTGSNSLQYDGKGTLNVVNGHIFVNSIDPQAFSVTNSGTVVAITCDVTGNYLLSKGTMSAQVRTGVRRTPDPLLTLPAPDTSGLTVQSPATLYVNASKKGTTLQPGIYKGGINISGSGDVTLSPGTYVMQGGGFQASGSGDLTANNVLIYNTSGTSSAGPIVIATSGEVQMSPSYSGAYQGISMFQDRGVTQPLALTGNGGTATISGLVYAPSATVVLWGNGNGNGKKSTDTLGGAFICSSMYAAGSGDINIDPGSTALQLSEIAVVE